ELAIDTSAASAEVSQGGIQINLIPRDGGNTFNGTMFASGSRPFLQSGNYTDELKQRGLATPNKLIYTFDVNPSAGGTLIRDKLWFYSAGRWKSQSHVRRRDIQKRECGQSERVDVCARHGASRRRGAVLPQHKHASDLAGESEEQDQRLL